MPSLPVLRGNVSGRTEESPVPSPFSQVFDALAKHRYAGAKPVLPGVCGMSTVSRVLCGGEQAWDARGRSGFHKCNHWFG